MASDNPWKSLREGATCDICWNPYVNPYILDCGHTFCQGCIFQCWKEFPYYPACPQCRIAVETKTCRFNASLARVAEIAKQLSKLTMKEAERKKFCEKHPDPSQTVFCANDQITFCKICEGTRHHKNHYVSSVEDTARSYKVWYSHYIGLLKVGRLELMKHKFCLIQWSELLQTKSVTECQTIADGFKQMHELLKNQEDYLIQRLESLPREKAEKRDKDNVVTLLYLNIFTLENTIRLLEEKASQPALDFLQDAVELFDRCHRRVKMHSLEDASLDAKWGVWEVIETSAVTGRLTKYFRDIMINAFAVLKGNVTLDKDSNHPQVLLSSDGKSMKWKRTAPEGQLPNLPSRFDKLFCVVGCQGFSVGRYLWDVIVKGQGEWALGVAKISVKRKGFFNLCTEEGVFAVGKVKQQYRVINMPTSPVLALDRELKWIRVSLNCSAGQVNFYDVERAMRIFGFTDIGSFRQTFLPFFWLKGQTELTIIQ